MKIKALRTCIVLPRWLFLKVETDAGLSGSGAPLLGGNAGTLAAAVAGPEDTVPGRDLRRIEDLWQLLHRNGCYRGGPALSSGTSGLDMALRGIRGRDLGVPVHPLPGRPVRQRVRSCCWIGGDRLADPSEGARAPHCPLGPVALVASLQVDAICHHAVIREPSLGMHYNAGADLGEYTLPGHGFSLPDGWPTIPDSPGLGIKVNEAAVFRTAGQGHRLRAPVRCRADRSIAEC